jgi:hypothetical protein
MPVSKREAILVRMFEIFGEEYITAQTVVRNRALLKTDDRPAIALMDGDERARLTGDGRGQGNTGRQQMTPQLMTMTPQVFVLPDEKLPANEGIGELVNMMRDIIVRTLANDPTLLALLGSNGSIAYLGMETDLKSGGALQGQCRLDFALTYVLDPYVLL